MGFLREWWCVGIILVLLIVLLPNLSLSTSPSIPVEVFVGAPYLWPVVKDVEAEPRFYVSEGESLSTDLKFIIGLEGHEGCRYLVKVYKDGEVYAGCTPQAISLNSNSDYVKICEYGHYETGSCQQRIKDYDLSLNIVPPRELQDEFYDHYVETETILSLPDWEVEGKVVGLSDDNREVVKFTIRGNFNYTPPSKEFMEYSGRRPLEDSDKGLESSQGERSNPTRLFLVLGILAILLAVSYYKIIRPRQKT